MFDILFLDNLDQNEHSSAFETGLSVEERQKQDIKNRLRLKKIEIISERFLLAKERSIFKIYLYHNHSIRDLSCFVKTNERYLMLHTVRRVTSLLKKFVYFFDSCDYKKIDFTAKTNLSIKQYTLLKDYLKLHHYRRCGLLYGITEQTVYERILKIKEKLRRFEICYPLVDLIEFLQNYRYDKKNDIF